MFKRGRIIFCELGEDLDNTNQYRIIINNKIRINKMTQMKKII